MNENFTNVSVDTSVPVIDEWITSSDGVEIYTRTWKAVSNKPIATVVFIHGFGEHIKRYNHVFDKFGRENIEVYAYDQRGAGETAVKNKNPGMTGGWKVATADITEALISRRKEGVPQFLMGHSMGGGLTLNYASEGPERHRIAGYICSSPLIRLSPNAPQSKKRDILLSIVPAISKLLPNVTICADVEATHISRDPAEIDKYKEDPLIHNIASLITIGDMVSGGKLVINKEHANITSPVYISHGSADLVTCPKASKLFFERMKSENKTFIEWEDRHHEPHNDYGNTEVIQSYIQWILKQVNSRK
ncbi:Alpha/Beta hydrolase protein [Gigaspora rosea]|uniref:Alpha/Beta hydrolase protein n=1 Tax=Gigaspora rosea TaxID=44941 RepID=A0A397UJG6_9GLOM|nr:Alpha/Beta hydrolase protein [Gigaspora rosea]